MNAGAADAHLERPGLNAGEAIDMEIGNQVSEVIGFEDHAAPGVPGNRGGSKALAANVVGDDFSETRGGNAAGEMRGGGRENIAAMKCSADLRSHQARIGNDTDLRWSRIVDHREDA